MPNEIITSSVNNRSKLLKFPKSFAFVIGINHYPLINAHLISAVPDARAIAKVLKQQQGFDHVELLLGMSPETPQENLTKDLSGVQISFDANKATILDLFKRLKDPNLEPKITPKDCIVFYYAGHGKAGEFDKGPAGYLLPSDTKPETAALETKSLIPMENMFETLRDLNCHHTLLILDCCFAGKFRYVGQKSRDVSTPFFMPMYQERFERFKRERAWQVLVSAGPQQTAADWMGDRTSPGVGIHSPFAEALIEALEGKAEIKPSGKNLGDGVLTSQELFIYLWNKVESITRANPDFHIQYPDLFPMGDHKGGQFIFFDPKNKLNFANQVKRNPYKGLQPFEAEDADLFFGRDRVIKTLHEKVLKTNLFVVTAPSGSGKSSFVKAGLFPKLKELDYDFLLIRPGTHPMKQLETIAEELDPTKKQLFLIDQYEELFTECTDPEEREKFESALSELFLASKEQPLKIILTMRSDFEWQLEASDFGKSFWDKENLYTFLFRLPPMNLDELRDALVGPAWVEAYDFKSDELVNFILEEVSYAPGALPLLSFTMSELYKITTNKDRIFTFQNYKEKLGGVNGALSKIAGALYDKLPDDAHRKIMKHIMLRMVRLNDGSFSSRRILLGNPRSRIPNELLNELDFSNDQDDIMVVEVLKQMKDALLITQGEDNEQPFVEPAHDSLINFWPMCLQWIDKFGKENLLLQRQLWQAVLDHHQTTDIEEQEQFDQDIKAVAPTLEMLNPKDLLTSISSLWDNSPKLLQVLNEIDFEPAKELTDTSNIRNTGLPTPFEIKTEKAPKKEDYYAALFDGLSEEELSILFYTQANWLNKEEIGFILKSWNLKQDRFAKLREERDEAIKAKEAAVRKTKEAESLSITAFVRSLPQEELPQALRLMEIAYSKTLPNPAPSFVLQTLTTKFYNQWSEDGEVVCPFINGDLIHDFDNYESSRFTPDKSHVLTMSKSRGLKIWEPKGEHIVRLNYAPDSYQDFILSENGQYLLVILKDEKPQCLNLKGEVIIELKKIIDPPKTFKVTSDTMHILTMDDFGYASLWDQEGELINKEELWYASFSPNGRFILSSNKDDRSYLHDGRGVLIAGLNYRSSKTINIYFSSDGLTILGTYTDEVPTLWNLKGEAIAKLGHPESPGMDAVYSPDGQLILTWPWSNNSTAKLWNTKGELIADLNQHTDTVYRAVFAPWDVEKKDKLHIKEQIIFTCSTDQTCKLWDREGKVLATFQLKGEHVTTVVFSDDLQYIATTCIDGFAKIWNTQGELICKLDEIKKNNTQLSFSSSFLDNGLKTEPLILSRSHSDKVWNLQGELLADLSKYTKGGKVIGFAPFGNGEYILFESKNKIKYCTIKGALIKDIVKSDKQDNRIKVTEDQQYFSLTAFQKETQKTKMEIWTTDGDLLASLDQTGELEDIVLSPRGKFLVTKIWNNSKLYTNKGVLISELDNFEKLFFAPDENFFITAHDSSHVNLWNVEGKLITKLDQHEKHISKIAFAPIQDKDGEQLFLTASDDKTVKVWNREGKLIADLKGHEDRLAFADFSNDGNYVLTYDRDNKIKVWNRDWQLMPEIETAFSKINSIVFSPNGQFILTSFTSGSKAVLWTSNGEMISEIGESLRFDKLKVQFFPKEDLFLKSGNHTTLWDVKGNLIKKLQGSFSNYDNIISPDGQFFILKNDKVAKLYNTKGELIADLDKHIRTINSIEFSSDSQFILTASTDKTAKLWNIKGECLADLNKHDSSVQSAIFSPDGRFILTLTRGNRSIKLWPTPSRIYYHLLFESGIEKLTSQQIGAYGLLNMINNDEALDATFVEPFENEKNKLPIN